MAAEMENFSSRCKKLPKKLREWEAYNDLRKQIEDTQIVLVRCLPSTDSSSLSPAPSSAAPLTFCALLLFQPPRVAACIAAFLLLVLWALPNYSDPCCS